MTMCLDCPHVDYEHWNATLDDFSYAQCQIPGCKCRGLRTAEWSIIVPTKSTAKSLIKSAVTPADTDPKFEKIIALVFKDAELAKSNGQTHVSDLVVTQARYFRYGLSRELPPEWKNYSDELARLEDHEYQVYLRLKKKFEGK